MAKEPISIKVLVKDAFSGVGPLGWVFMLLKPTNKVLEMLGEVDLFETYGGSVGKFLDTGWGTLGSVTIGALIIGYAIYSRLRDTPATNTQRIGIPKNENSDTPNKAIVNQAPAPQDFGTNPEAVKALQPREFVPPELTPERLFSFYQELTAIQAAELTKHNISQWMRVTGTLGDVSPWSGYASQVTFDHSKTPLLERTWLDSTRIHMYFRDLKQINRLKNMNQGGKVTVIGQLMEVSSVVLSLDNCELVDPNDEGSTHSP